MTDKHAITIILIITLIVLVIACYQCESTQAAVGAFIVMWVLLIRVGKSVSGWLDKLEAEEKATPL